MKVFLSEVSKLASLPFIWFAFIAGLIVPNGIALIAYSNGSNAATIDIGFAELSVGVLGAIVLGGMAIGSEFVTEGGDAASGRQITTSLIAVPSRIRLLTAKVGATAIITAVLAIFAIISVFTTIQFISEPGTLIFNEDMFIRMIGVVIYWILMALLTLGLTVLTRNAIIPIAVMVINSSAITLTYILTQMNSLATYLPDMAGQKMFFRGVDTGIELTPPVGGIVMGTWVLLLLILAGFSFSRRDVG